MISIPTGVRVLLAMRPVDFRKGAHSLAALAAEVLREDPFAGVAIVFRAKRVDRVKILLWDGSGLVLVWNYLASYCVSYNLM
jgi:transposase